MNYFVFFIHLEKIYLKLLFTYLDLLFTYFKLKMKTNKIEKECAFLISEVCNKPMVNYRKLNN